MSKPSPDTTRSWPIRAIALLLILQAMIFVGLNIYNISDQLAGNPKIGLETILAQIDADEDRAESSPKSTKALEVFLSAILLMPLAIPAAVAAAGFLFMLRFSWLLAMSTQVAGLLFCLMLYIEFKPAIVYPIMVYCILMVLYLNIHEVRLAFLSNHSGKQQV